MSDITRHLSLICDHFVMCTEAGNIRSSIIQVIMVNEDELKFKYFLWLKFKLFENVPFSILYQRFPR